MEDALADVRALGLRDLRQKWLPQKTGTESPDSPTGGSVHNSKVVDGTEGEVDLDDDKNLANMDDSSSGHLTAEEDLRASADAEDDDEEYDSDYEVDIEGAVEDLRSAHASKAPAPKLNRSTVVALLRQVDREGVRETEPSEGLTLAAENVCETHAGLPGSIVGHIPTVLNKAIYDLQAAVEAE